MAAVAQQDDERLREAAGRAARNRWRKKICAFAPRFDTLAPEAQEQSRELLREYGHDLDCDLETDLDKALDAVRAGKDPRGVLDWENPPSDNDVESLTTEFWAKNPQAPAVGVRSFKSELRALRTIVLPDAMRSRSRSRETSTPPRSASSRASSSGRDPPRDDDNDDHVAGHEPASRRSGAAP